jgi:hypothetical protein
MVVEHRDEYPLEWEAMTTEAATLGLTAETLQSWVRRDQVNQGRVFTTDERERLKELEKEVKESDRGQHSGTQHRDHELLDVFRSHPRGGCNAA